MASLGLKGLTT